MEKHPFLFRMEEHDGDPIPDFCLNVKHITFTPGKGLFLIPCIKWVSRAFCWSNCFNSHYLCTHLQCWAISMLICLIHLQENWHFWCTLLWILTQAEIYVTTTTVKIQNRIKTTKNSLVLLLCNHITSLPLTSNLFSITIALSGQAYYKWNHGVCEFLRLTSFTWHNATEIHANCHVYQ